MCNRDQHYGSDGATGNLASKAGVNYTYDTTHKHAVASLSNGNSYTYDANGNPSTSLRASMITRQIGSQTFSFTYDADRVSVPMGYKHVTVSDSTTVSFPFE